jgi:hypothetical protein
VEKGSQQKGGNMKKLFALAACAVLVGGAAFATEPLPYLTANPEANTAVGYPHYGTDAVLIDNLNEGGSNTYSNGLAGCAYFSSWVAFDYTPSSNVTVRQITLDYVYNSSPLKNTINFRLYSGTNPSSGSLIRSWDVAASNYTEANTGWVAFSRPVYRATVPIPDQALTGSTKYWFAYTSPNSSSANIIYWLVWTQIKEDEVWWYLNSVWGPGSTQGAGGRYEQSYRLEDSQVGVAPASMGSIKALFE